MASTATDVLTTLDPATGQYRQVGHPGDGPGRRELWEVTSVDRVWRFRREDLPGTPWAIDRWNFGAGRWVEVANSFGSLDVARHATADETWWLAVRSRLAGLPAPAPVAPSPGGVTRWRLA